MGSFLKTFIISLVCFSIAAFAGITVYSKVFDTKALPIPENQVDKLGLDEKDPFERSILDGKRLNTLILGVKENMTDTIMLCSFNIETKDVDMISIPRDTYHHRPGYDGPADKKINAVYSSQGVERLIDNVQEVLGEKIPIHHYAIIDYKGVERIVDVVGGVKIDVPINMKYDDLYDSPPLRIRISKGLQVLDGKKSMEFLRYRKPNEGEPGGYPEGDTGRVKAQQVFIKAFAKKAIGAKLPSVIKTAIESVKTDISVSQGMSYASRMVGITDEKINMTIIPGEAKYIGQTSYYLHDEEETKQLIEGLYSENKSTKDMDMNKVKMNENK